MEKTRACDQKRTKITRTERRKKLKRKSHRKGKSVKSREMREVSPEGAGRLWVVINTFEESVGSLEALGDRLDAAADEGHFKAVVVAHQHG